MSRPLPPVTNVVCRSGCPGRHDIHFRAAKLRWAGADFAALKILTALHDHNALTGREAA